MRIALALTILLAGCLIPGDGPAEPGPQPDPVTPEMVDPVWITLYLQPDGTMSPDPSADTASVTLDWGYQQWLDGTPAPLWLGDMEGPFTVLEGNLTLFYEANMATTSGDVRPELTAWWGSNFSLIDHLFIDGPDTVQAGTVIEASSALRVPPGGLTLRTGETALRVGTYYLDGPQIGAMDLLMGGATPSRLELLVEPWEWRLYDATQVLDVSGNVSGGRCAVTVNPADTADAYHDIEVGPEVEGLTVALSGNGQPTPDIDLVVYGPNGTVVGGGHSSFDHEGAVLWQGNLAVDGPGTYTIRVVACTPQSAAYMLFASTYVAKPEAGAQPSSP